MILTTARLTLRPIAMADYPAYAALMASVRSRFLGGPFDTAATWGLFCHEVALWNLFGVGGLMIDVRETGDTVGVVEINQGPLFPEPELGWQLFEGHEGQGYATEAARALRDWGLAVRRLPTLVSYMDPDNRASARVAERLGARLDPDAQRQPGCPEDLVYRHALPEAA